MVGKILRDLKFISEIGQGGMGLIYLAEHVHLGKKMAVKCLHPELTRNPDFRKRFDKEARAQAKMDHSNIVHVNDYFEENGTFYLVMDYINGTELEEVLEEIKSLALDQALVVFKKVLEGLNYAHSKGVIHRDIKPSNILITSENQIKIMDFGIAIIAGDKRLTKMNSPLGTVCYMSPEQILGNVEIDQRSDIYASGIVLFEMLTGLLPFDAETEIEICNKHIKDPIPDLNLFGNFPLAIQNIIIKCTQKKKEDRYKNCTEVLSDIKAYEMLKNKDRNKSSNEKIIDNKPISNQKRDETNEYNANKTDSSKKDIVKTVNDVEKHSKNALNDENNLSETTLNDSDNQSGLKKIALIAFPLLIIIITVVTFFVLNTDHIDSPGKHVEIKYRDWNSVTQFKTLEGHSNRVGALSFSKNGRMLASASFDKSIILWDTVHFKNQYTYKGHEKNVMSIDFSPNSKYLVSGSWDKQVKLWDIEANQAMPYKMFQNDKVQSVCFSPDGKMIASTGLDKIIKFWDVNTGIQLFQLTGHKGVIKSIVFSPDGQLIASGGYDKAIRLWDIKKKRLYKSLVGHKELISSVRFSPNGKLLASGSYDNTIKLWNVNTLSLISTLQKHSDDVNSISFSPCSSYLASSGYDSSIIIWSIEKRQPVNIVKKIKSLILDVQFSPDGFFFASCGSDNKITIWK